MMVNYIEGVMKVNDHAWIHSGCDYSDFGGIKADPPFGLCTLQVRRKNVRIKMKFWKGSRFGKHDILIIGNGYAVNQADTIYSAFKNMAKSFRIFSLPGKVKQY